MKVQELFENVSSQIAEVKYTFYINNASLNEVLSQDHGGFYKRVAKVSPGKWHRVDVRKVNTSATKCIIVCTFGAVPIDKINTDNLDHWGDEALSELSDAINNVFIDDEYTSAVYISDVPSTKISAYKIIFEADAPHTKLTGIDKKIGKCGTFTINNAEKISGGVLSLLNLNVRELTIFSFTQVCEWGNIIEKHFKADKDMLECQEELIDAGLQEFANL